MHFLELKDCKILQNMDTSCVGAMFCKGLVEKITSECWSCYLPQGAVKLLSYYVTMCAQNMDYVFEEMLSKAVVS
jgi:hypothetical protein